MKCMVIQRSRCIGRAALIVGVVLTGTAFSMQASADTEPATDGTTSIVRHISPDQYRRSVEDIFGSGLQLGGRFEPEFRANGLLAIGSGESSVTASGFEQYYGMARAIADQVLSEPRRSLLLACRPSSPTQPDDRCAAQFLEKVGLLLFRRPLEPGELQAQVAVANSASRALEDFYAGLAVSLSNMMVSPAFLFREEKVGPDPDHSGQYRVDAYTKASIISFLLWNTAPDGALLRAASDGTLDTKEGLDHQVDRMLASPRLEDGVGAFFADMLGFDQFASLAKDAAIYPKFTAKAAIDAQEQTLRTITDLLVTNRGDYRDIFTTRKTFLTPTLGILYGVAVSDDTPIGEPEKWLPYEFPEGDPHLGILTEASFVALHSHPGRSSSTIRGKALREAVLCQKVPDPPGNVNFAVVQDTTNPVYRTARERLTAHRTQPTCAGCHKLIDPMGLALENFDGAGGFRTTENGAKIDTSGELDGMKFADSAGLGKAVHDNPATPVCVLNRMVAYASGQAPPKSEAAWIKYLASSFASSGYRITDLLRLIATSDALYRRTAPELGSIDESATQVAMGVSSELEKR